MDNFDLKKFLVENKLTTNSKLLKEVDTSNWGDEKDDYGRSEKDYRPKPSLADFDNDEEAYKKYMEDNFPGEPLEEGILTWIKDKAAGLAKKINQLKGDGLMSLFTKILPADLVNFVKSKATAYKPKPEIVKEYKNTEYTELLERRKSGDDEKVQYRVKYLNPQFKPEEEVNKMSDQEYQAYLQQIADNTIFPVDFEGEMRDSSEMALYRFMKSKGLRITTELVTDAKPTLNDCRCPSGPRTCP